MIARPAGMRLLYAASLVLLCTGGAFAQTGVSVPLRAKVYGLKDAVPDAQGIHRMAILRALNKTTGRAINLNAPVGVPVRFGTLSITVRTCHTVPPEEPPETTAFLQIDETKENAPVARVFSGWMFASTPGLNGLEHPVYDVWVITCSTDEPSSEPQAPSTKPGALANPAAPKP